VADMKVLYQILYRPVKYGTVSELFIAGLFKCVLVLELDRPTLQYIISVATGNASSGSSVKAHSPHPTRTSCDLEYSATMMLRVQSTY
jgi:hypothetical protein